LNLLQHTLSSTTAVAGYADMVADETMRPHCSVRREMRKPGLRWKGHGEKPEVAPALPLTFREDATSTRRAGA
jgi:hypothetical protein